MGNSHKLLHSSLAPPALKLRWAGFVLILLFLLLRTASCNTVDPPPDKTVLNLTLEDVSCTEAWITLTTANLQLPTTLNLLKDNTVTKTINLQTADTLLYIDSLLPNQTYKYQVSSNQYLASHIVAGSILSNELSVTTLDTTSHNFTWQTWTFGELSAGASGIFDVVLIDDNNIYAVGRITSLDSLGNPDPNLYNAVYWDGQKWELKKIGDQGGWTCHTVFAFSAYDIWFEGTIHWDGTSYTVYNNGWPLMPNGDGWQVNKMWGISSNDLYAVGNAGNIAHWNGSKWTRIESGITICIQNMYGNTVLQQILAIASEEFDIVPTALLKIDSKSNSVKIISEHNLPPAMKDIWFRPNLKYIVVGDGIYSTKSLEGKDSWKREVSTLTNEWYSIAIDGENFNDIVVSGVAGELLHFNGCNWENLTSQIGINGINRLAECKIRNGVIVSVGFTLNGEGIIILGRRR